MSLHPHLPTLPDSGVSLMTSGMAALKVKPSTVKIYWILVTAAFSSTCSHTIGLIIWHSSPLQRQREAVGAVFPHRNWEWVGDWERKDAHILGKRCHRSWNLFSRRWDKYNSMFTARNQSSGWDLEFIERREVREALDLQLPWALVHDWGVYWVVDFAVLGSFIPSLLLLFYSTW